MIHIFSDSRYKIDKDRLKEKTKEFLMALEDDSSSQDLNIVFVGRRKMKHIAVTYKKEQEALPVLSFPYDKVNDRLLGEIVICYPQAVLLAAERERKVEDMIVDLIRHGIETIL
ncbi:MAG TPA: rRNA maturation RNase YbeY [Patescibacteria group bacterium]|nr:rRNA maturation RNase YbeY [Patescibacteria group bacterium]